MFVTSSLGGTITNIVVTGFETVEFDYTAPTFTPGTAGPKDDSITIFTLAGGGAVCTITVHLDPFVDDCEIDWSGFFIMVFTTGVDGGTFVIGMIMGGNFLLGGHLHQVTRA